jgi:TonB family protein
MTPDRLYAISVAMGNHLWQSTLFALMVATLAAALRKNQAGVRFRLWLAASLKFLVPFSVLISLGDKLAAAGRTTQTQPALYLVMQTISQPFHPASHAQGWLGIAGMLWLGGFVFFGGRSWLRWRQVAVAMEGATPMSNGREVQALRRLQGTLRTPVALRVSHRPVEPGIFGILRTTLLWPASISAQLDDCHLEAILAHELEHVRRHDNLTAAMHMMVEAIFWFHPVVWWLGARLVEERERACDEAVIESGNHPQIYAESILKTCAFCVQLPVACISGVTGGSLKERIVRIMTQHQPVSLTISRKLLLAAIGLAAVGGPICFGLLDASHVMALTTATQPSEIGRVYHIGKDVTAPKLVFAPDPQFSERALRAKYEGVCVVSVIVDADGKPQRVQVMRHLGMGLDEKAVEAVQQYKFTPAKRFGKPVAVEVNIEVNFRRY